MAISYSPLVAIRGVAAEPITEELIYENSTIANELVTFEDDIKAETIFTEVSATATMQAYTCGAPTSSGSLGLWDSVVTPAKVLFYQEFCPDNLRFSRFKRDMKPGAWNLISDEFQRVVIGGVYAKQIAASLEVKFWNGITTATKAAVAALTPGTAQTSAGAAEQTWAAAQTASLFDGAVAKMIYNDSNVGGAAALGGRVKVLGTAITASNIKAEYDKLYAAIPSVSLASGEQPYIYAPFSHRQLITIADNNVTNYNKAFSVIGDKYYFNGLEIKFVPLSENVMIAAKKSHLVWATDLKSDFNYMEINKVQNNADTMFIKNVMTIAAHIAGQSTNVLYIG